MRKLLCLSIIVVLISLSVAKKHHKDKKFRYDLNVRKPSANPFHLGKKHHSGRLRGEHLQFKDHGKKRIKSVHDDDSDWMKIPSGKECKTVKCGPKEFCISNSRGEEKCIRRRDFTAGRRLFKKFHKRKELVKGDMKGDGLKEKLMAAEHMKDVYELMKDYKKPGSKHHHSTSVKGDKIKSILEKNQDKLFKEATDVQECRPTELYELRSRLTSYFVMRHTESRQRHHRLHKKHKKHRMSKKGRKFKKFNRKQDTLETESHGKCKCSKSIMWEFRKQDVNADGHLDHDELAVMEMNKREPCMKPLFKGCDKDGDKRIARGEWCCCLADTIPPCFEKRRHTDPSDWQPRCDKEGFYEREQCHEKSGYCWCVDINGNEIKDTKTLGPAHCGKYDPNGHLIKM